MNRWQKRAATGALAALLSVSPPAAAQAGWVWESIQIYRAWQEGRVLEELGWLAARKVGEKLLENNAAPDTAPAEPVQPLPPLAFDLDGSRYLLGREDAVTLEEGHTYPMSCCPGDSGARLFVFPSAACPDGSAPQASDYSLTRTGDTVTAERK